MELMNEDTLRIFDEVEVLKGKYEALKKFAIAKKILLPPELETV
jgi:transcription factor MAFF/G/K